MALLIMETLILQMETCRANGLSSVLCANFTHFSYKMCIKYTT